MVTCDANDNDEIYNKLRLKPFTHDYTNRLISFSSFLTQGNCPLMQDETVAANTNFPFLKGGLQKNALVVGLYF